MAAIVDRLKFYQGPTVSSSFFFVEDGRRAKRNARVSLAMIGTIQEKLAVTGSPACIAILFPEPFKDQLKKAGISVDDAWGFMEATLSTGLVLESPWMKSQAEAKRRDAERLARILASVDGKDKTAEALGQELWALMAGHLEEAIKILNEWKSVYGCGKGGHIIVGNRANRIAKKGSNKGSAQAA
jgi:hypothetical protein